MNNTTLKLICLLRKYSAYIDVRELDENSLLQGANSLNSLEYVTFLISIEHEFDIELNMKYVIKAKTIKELAHAVDLSVKEREKSL